MRASVMLRLSNTVYCYTTVVVQLLTANTFTYKKLNIKIISVLYGY